MIDLMNICEKMYYILAPPMTAYRDYPYLPYIIYMKNLTYFDTKANNSIPCAFLSLIGSIFPYYPSLSFFD